MQEVEGNVFYHTASSTAFPQPKPGAAPSPGPLKVPAGQLRSVLGITHVNFVSGRQTLAVVDSSLAAGAQVTIDNFSFKPQVLSATVGSVVNWTNRDDMPHNIVSTGNKFSSPVLDTDQSFTFKFSEAGTYPYFCKLHPRMTGTIVVNS
jgi:plastocyanin